MSACSVSGRNRRGPRRLRVGGIARTRGIRAWLSWVLAAETPTDRGMPPRSVAMWIVLPDFPRSTGLGPVSQPLLGVFTGLCKAR
ncbi:hypothetical protein J2S53_001423 [Actinopolyspora lacussalsi]|nr:hypothetical protein [Actinopolyspora lacussalsi]